MTNSNVDISLTRPRLDATAKLLVFLSREDLGSDGPERAGRLAKQIVDWNEFLSLAAANFALPFVHLHMPHLIANGAPARLAADVKMMAMRVAMTNLAVQGGLVAFHKQCIQPVRAQHAYLKGPALAARYYRNPAIRMCRDVDVLVGPRDVHPVGKRALAHGYRLLLDDAKGVFTDDSQDINFIIRHADVVSLLSPDGVHFELHRHIEKHTPIFPTNKLLSSIDRVRIGHCDIDTISIEWLFCYIAYHHSRHFWSRLHWVSDIHALISHYSFDRAKVIELSCALGLSNTVQAALDFAALTGRPEEWSIATFASNGGRFLEACLHGLPGDSRYEFENWSRMFLFDFGDPWQVDPGWKGTFWTASALRRLRPNVDQYLKNRRPRWREFLYYVENATTISRNALKHLKPR